MLSIKPLLPLMPQINPSPLTLLDAMLLSKSREDLNTVIVRYDDHKEETCVLSQNVLTYVSFWDDPDHSGFCNYSFEHNTYGHGFKAVKISIARLEPVSWHVLDSSKVLFGDSPTIALWSVLLLHGKTYGDDSEKMPLTEEFLRRVHAKLSDLSCPAKVGGATTYHSDGLRILNRSEIDLEARCLASRVTSQISLEMQREFHAAAKPPKSYRGGVLR